MPHCEKLTGQRLRAGQKANPSGAKFLACMVLLLAILAGLPARERSHRKIYPVDSGVWTAMRGLYIAQGLALPSTTGPWSEDELVAMLDRLDTAVFTPAETAWYDYLAGILTGSRRPVEIAVIPSPEIHLHTNTEDFFLPDHFYRPVNTMNPLLGLEAELFLLRHSYIFFEWPVSARIYYANRDEAVKFPLSPQAGDRPFSVNIPMLAGGHDLDADIPYRGLFSVGGRGWYAAAGRDRLSWGPGESGNFVVGDHVHYHNNLRAALFNGRFKYTYNISSFVYPGEYYLGWDAAAHDYNPIPASNPNGAWSGVQNTGAEIKGVSLFIAHRAEARFFANRLNLALTDAIMYQSKNGTVGLAQLSPVMLLHNLYRDDNQNSILALEADFALTRGINLYAQFALDQFALPIAENGPQRDAASTPNAIGVMLGARAAFPAGGGGELLFEASLESAYTSPYLYLQSNTAGFNSNSFVKANRYYNGEGNYFFVEEFLGYRWGGDALVFNAHASLSRPGRWTARFNFLAMLHGTHDKWTAWSMVYSADSPSPPHDSFLTDRHETANYADPAGAAARNAVSLTLTPSVSGSLVVWKTLEVYGEADAIFSINHGNIQGRFAADFQLTLGVKYALRAGYP
ncbi:MAG: hypothetical protein LBC88_01865 [Spirochaetaceae bacterium]|jgi:hypothetical protein|nr:hypothetical protein [Spirochaetaceae bacterium]